MKNSVWIIAILIVILAIVGVLIFFHKESTGGLLPKTCSNDSDCSGAQVCRDNFCQVITQNTRERENNSQVIREGIYTDENNLTLRCTNQKGDSVGGDTYVYYDNFFDKNNELIGNCTYIAPTGPVPGCGVEGRCSSPKLLTEGITPICKGNLYQKYNCFIK